MDEAFSRTEILLGSSAMKKLNCSKVVVFGIGGVGSFVAEGLARCGIGHLVLVDADKVDITNINRQIHANTKTVGYPKVKVMKDRILDINPDAKVTTYEIFYDKASSCSFEWCSYDYVVDAIDTISSKIDLITTCKQLQLPIISSMGAGNKLDPTKFNVSDIYKTSTDPIAKVLRKELKKRKIDSLKVVYSTETPIKPNRIIRSEGGKISPGSISFIPSVVGLIIAGEVVKDLIDWQSL